MKRLRQWLPALIGALLVLTIAVMLFRWFEHNQVYHPTRTLEADGSELGRPFEDVFFQTRDGVKLNGWFFPGDTNSAGSEYVILYCHGNGGNLSHRLDAYQALLDTGASVFALEYRGYGRSEGRPSEEGTYRDAEAAYAWLRRRGFAAGRIVPYGESLGGGIATELCLRAESGGLILQSTFTSIPDMGREIYPWLPVKLLGTIRYDTRSKLPRLRVPVLVMHSRTDEIIGWHHGQNNFASARDPRQFCELQGDHNDPLRNRVAYVNGVKVFLGFLKRSDTSARP